MHEPVQKPSSCSSVITDRCCFRFAGCLSKLEVDSLSLFLSKLVVDLQPLSFVSFEQMHKVSKFPFSPQRLI